MPPRPTTLPLLFTRPRCPRCGRTNNIATATASPFALLPQRNPFHTSPAALNARHTSHLTSKNHYDRLSVPTNATPAEIKKSFYSLSKTHHPDANPSDPGASETFSLLSESYTVLSDPQRRATYDRDVLRLHQHRAHDAQPRGSYHSAGGRAPTGLSKRRGTFRGPPPSFYRNGAWGAHEDRRRRAHEESTGGAEEAARSGAFNSRPHHDHHHHHYQQQKQQQQQGPDPMGYYDEVPHFDKEGHSRTQRREDQRRFERGARAERGERVRESFDDGLGAGAQFVIVMGILAASSLASMAYYQMANATKIPQRRKRD